MAGKKGEYYLMYFGKETPTSWAFELPKAGINFPKGTMFTVDILDTWNMTATPVGRTFAVKAKDNYTYMSDGVPVELPGKPFIALRIRKVK